MFLSTISNLFRRIANDIDSGNCNISEEEQIEILSTFQKVISNDLKRKKELEINSEVCEIMAGEIMDMKEDISRLKGEEKKECKIYRINKAEKKY